MTKLKTFTLVATPTSIILKVHFHTCQTCYVCTLLPCTLVADFTVEGCFGTRKQDTKIVFISIKQKTVSLTSDRLVLDNASVHGSQCPYNLHL
jgi:hypothetical protein